MRDYDFIIAGGGISGLSLAYYLAHSPLAGSSILIVEAAGQMEKDHALSFWAREPTPFDKIISHSWNHLCIIDGQSDHKSALGSYRYNTLRSADYTAFIQQDLASDNRVEFLQGAIDRIEDNPALARVLVDNQEYTAKWVFDSRFRLADFHPEPRRYFSLQQHFKGWQVETGCPVFDPETATLFDFRVPQKNELRFFYVLPFSERHALVEYVLLSPDDYDATLRSYIENTLGIRDYQVLSKEGGITPLTSYPFPRRTGRRVMAIGIAGGRVKPTSGYAFTRIQRDSVAIVRSLQKTGSPFNIRADGHFYRFCDATLLQIMEQQGEFVKPIFTQLFKNNPIERVFRFLDETASPGQNLALMLSLPLPLFWQGLAQAAGQSLGINRRSI